MPPLIGTKIVEVPYFADQLIDRTRSVLIVGEHIGGGEGVSETVKELGFVDVTTTDIAPREENSWLAQHTSWKHVQTDFVEFDETSKYDYIISISVFEHFGFWFTDAYLPDGMTLDQCRWNHDLRGINKACRLLKDENSKLIITLPAGPFMNYDAAGRPFLRSYDLLRQHIVTNEIIKAGCTITNQRFFYTEDFNVWREVTGEINNVGFYRLYRPETPNVIWGITIQKISP